MNAEPPKMALKTTMPTLKNDLFCTDAKSSVLNLPYMVVYLKLRKADGTALGLPKNQLFQFTGSGRKRASPSNLITASLHFQRKTQSGVPLIPLVDTRSTTKLDEVCCIA